MGAAVPCSPPHVSSRRTQQSCLRAALSLGNGEGTISLLGGMGTAELAPGPSQPFLRWEDDSTDPQTHPPLLSACPLISCFSYHSSSVTPHPKPWPLGALHPSPDLLAEVRHMPTWKALSPDLVKARLHFKSPLKCQLLSETFSESITSSRTMVIGS